MNVGLEGQINGLFQAFQDAKKAAIVNNSVLSQKRLAEGLAEASLFLDKLFIDLVENRKPEELAEITFNPEAIKVLSDPEIFELFQKTEANLLQHAGLDAEVVVELLKVIKLLVDSGVYPEEDWQESLHRLSKTVRNKEAEGAAEDLINRHLLKRTVIAGGGIVLAATSIFLPPDAKFPGLAPLSTSMGAWFINAAAGDSINDYFGK